MWHNYVLTKCQLDNQSKKEKNMRAWRRNEPASIYNSNEGHLWWALIITKSCLMSYPDTKLL